VTESPTLYMPKEHITDEVEQPDKTCHEKHELNPGTDHQCRTHHR
jgi:hypothetical protein